MGCKSPSCFQSQNLIKGLGEKSTEALPGPSKAIAGPEKPFLTGLYHNLIPLAPRLNREEGR